VGFENEYPVDIDLFVTDLPADLSLSRRSRGLIMAI
jgi:hypothetical protein